jgi:hypothetical protein
MPFRSKLTKRNAMLAFRQAQFQMFCMLKQPALFLLGISLSYRGEKTCIKLPFYKRNQNYLRQMAFAPILAGAECAAAFPLVSEIYLNKLPIKLMIKSGDFDISRPLKSTGIFMVPNIDDVKSELVGEWRSKHLKIPVNLYDHENNIIGQFKFEAVLKQWVA